MTPLLNAIFWILFFGLIFFKKKKQFRCLARLLKYMSMKEYPNLSSLTQHKSFNPTFLITTNPGNPLKNKQRYLSINPEQTSHNLLKDQDKIIQYF